MVHICKPSTWDVEEEGSGVQGHLQVYSKMETILGLHEVLPQKFNFPFPSTKAQGTSQGRE